MRKGKVIIEFICCGVCHDSVRLDEQSVIAAAEVITFSEAHGLHARWSLSFRAQRDKSDGRVQCRPVPGLHTMRRDPRSWSSAVLTGSRQLRKPATMAGPDDDE